MWVVSSVRLPEYVFWCTGTAPLAQILRLYTNCFKSGRRSLLCPFLSSKPVSVLPGYLPQALRGVESWCIRSNYRSNSSMTLMTNRVIKDARSGWYNLSNARPKRSSLSLPLRNLLYPGPRASKDSLNANHLHMGIPQGASRSTRKQANSKGRRHKKCLEMLIITAPFGSPRRTDHQC